ncbi:MAG: methyltransferase domain-containing protein [Candidatus Levybacteria bacterium]|nr:methyltransferase domain-containing protein [Candidatus Levybacteria bacterium]
MTTQEKEPRSHHSYEEFTNRPFYIALNKETMRLAPRPVRYAVDIGTGKTAMIDQMFDEKKLTIDFQIRGYDPDEEALAGDRIKYYHYRDKILFIEAWAENIPLQDRWSELTVCANAIHLTEVPKTIKEFARITDDEGTLLINTAYTRDHAYPEASEASWGALVVNARIAARKTHGITDIPKPVQLQTYKLEDYEAMLKDAGFVVEKAYPKVVHMNREDLEAICHYDEFAKGALPGVELELAKELLVDAIKPTLERRGSDSLPRGWGIIKATRLPRAA